MQSSAALLRELVARPLPAVVPLVLDPLGAKLAEAAGFEALYLGGGTLGYAKTCTEANLSLTQMSQAGLEIRAATALPLILDGQCGWGDPMHVGHTVRMAEATGFAGIELEDQLMPKRAHHHVGTEHLIPVELMAEKIRTAVAARRDPDFVIIARTNGCRTDGIEVALRRAEAYRAAGADMLLVLPKRPEEAEAIGRRIPGPLFYMMLDGVGSVGLSRQELADLGYRLVVDALTPFFAQAKALRQCYGALARWQPDPLVSGGIGPECDEIHHVIGLDRMLDIERRTVERPATPAHPEHTHP